MSGAANREVIYEVNVDLDAGIAESYRQWLNAHVQEILSLPGFTGARILDVVEPTPAEGRMGMCVQYALRDAASLDTYLREHAPRLRAEGVARFGERFRTQRRVLREPATGWEASGAT